jgi:hypothetical protein
MNPWLDAINLTEQKLEDAATLDQINDVLVGLISLLDAGQRLDRTRWESAQPRYVEVRNKVMMKWSQVHAAGVYQ